MSKREIVRATQSKMPVVHLNKPQQEIDAMILSVQENTFFVNGHNHRDKRLRLYLPGNGGLLSAVSMMAAGWDGSASDNPGFPKEGKRNVKWDSSECRSQSFGIYDLGLTIDDCCGRKSST